MAHPSGFSVPQNIEGAPFPRLRSGQAFCGERVLVLLLSRVPKTQREQIPHLRVKSDQEEGVSPAPVRDDSVVWCGGNLTGVGFQCKTGDAQASPAGNRA